MRMMVRIPHCFRERDFYLEFVRLARLTSFSLTAAENRSSLALPLSWITDSMNPCPLVNSYSGSFSYLLLNTQTCFHEP